MPYQKLMDHLKGDNKKEIAIEIAGICIDCDNVSNCDFIKDIKSYIMTGKSAGPISDIEIDIFSCDKYEFTDLGIKGDESACTNCRQSLV